MRLAEDAQAAFAAGVEVRRSQLQSLQAFPAAAQQYLLAFNTQARVHAQALQHFQAQQDEALIKTGAGKVPPTGS